MSTARLLLLACAATGLASAQSLTVSPTAINFFYQSGSANTPPQQTLQVTLSPAAASSVTVNFTSPQLQNLIFLDRQGAQPSASSYPIGVFLFANNLPNGTYTANITISATGVANPVIIPVTVNVSNLPLLVPTSTQLSFQFALNGAAPPAQTLGITTTSNVGLGFSAAAQVLTGGTTWLAVSPTNGTAGVLNGAPANLGVSVNPANLPVGTYQGNIVIAAAGVGNSPLTVPVTLRIVDEIRLTVTPNTLSFDFQVGGPPPADRSISVSTSGIAVPFSTQVATQTGGNWLTVSPTQGTTSANLNVSANITGLGAGTYQGTITITAGGATNSPQTVAVTLRVSTDPLMVPNPANVIFTHQVGGANPARQAVVLTNQGNSLALTVTTNTQSGGSWLSAVPGAAGSPTNIVITANPQGLNPGVYSGNVVVTGAGAANSPLNIPATLVVSNDPQLRVDKNTLQFGWQTGAAAPATQTIAISSTGVSTGFTASAATSGGGNWLSVVPATGSTPGNVSVAIVTANLTAGVYFGTVTIQGSNPGSVPINIPVRLVVSANPLLVVPLDPLSFNFSAGGTLPPNQSLNIQSTSSTINFSASPLTSLGGGWLRVAPGSGTAPSTVAVGVDTLGLTEGTYTGLVQITAAGVANSPQYVPVIYTITRTADLIVPTTPVTFTGSVGGQAPADQTITIGSSGVPLEVRVSVQTLSGGNWLTVTPTVDLTPARLTVRANLQGLDAGTYTGTITITSAQATNSPRILPVTLTVSPGLPNMILSRESVPIGASSGGAQPATQQVQVTSNGANFPITTAVATTTGGNWLSVQTSSASTPATLTLTANITGLAAGTYNGSVTVTSAGAANSPRTVAVVLTITAPVGGEITAFVNAASFLNSAAVPGMIATLGGTGLGPAVLAGLRLTPNGTVDTNVANTRVLFDGIPAPIIYVSANQTAVVVPYAVAGRLTTRVQVEVNGVLSNAFERPVQDSNPGFFTANSSGTGNVAAANAESGGINAPNNPAARGTVVVLYATGEGQTNPAGVDGSVPDGRSVPLRSPLLPVSVRIGGQPAQVLYAGSAPLFVSGVMQLNVRVPENIGTGAVPIDMTIGVRTSPAGTTISVR